MHELLAYERKNFSLKESDYRQRMNDLKDYLTQTVHDLKVNLSVCELAVNRLENEMEIANKLLYQIEQMKFRINQALFITRANHYSEDVVSGNVDLEKVVKEAIADNAEFFIHKGISIKNDLMPYHFISDKSGSIYHRPDLNSSKYAGQNGEITILAGRMKRPTTCIER